MVDLGSRPMTGRVLTLRDDPGEPVCDALSPSSLPMKRLIKRPNRTRLPGNSPFACEPDFGFCVGAIIRDLKLC
jgi:hypothetical protein